MTLFCSNYGCYIITRDPTFYVYIVRLKHIGRPGRALYFPAVYVFKET